MGHASQPDLRGPTDTTQSTADAALQPCRGHQVPQEGHRRTEKQCGGGVEGGRGGRRAARARAGSGVTIWGSGASAGAPVRGRRGGAIAGGGCGRRRAPRCVAIGLRRSGQGWTPSPPPPPPPPPRRGAAVADAAGRPRRLHGGGRRGEGGMLVTLSAVPTYRLGRPCPWARCSAPPRPLAAAVVRSRPPATDAQRRRRRGWSSGRQRRGHRRCGRHRHVFHRDGGGGGAADNARRHGVAAASRVVGAAAAATDCGGAPRLCSVPTGAARASGGDGSRCWNGSFARARHLLRCGSFCTSATWTEKEKLICSAFLGGKLRGCSLRLAPSLMNSKF